MDQIWNYLMQTEEVPLWCGVLLFFLLWHLIAQNATLKERAAQWEARAKGWESSSDNWAQECETLQQKLDEYLATPPRQDVKSDF